MTLAEQIAAFKAKLAELLERVTAIMQKAADETRTLDDEEASEHDSIQTEVKAVEAHLKRLGDLEKAQAAAAAPVGADPATGSVVSAPSIHVRTITDTEEKFQGQNFTRRCIAKALASLSDGELSPGQIAEQRWGKTNPQLVEVIKAGVAGGGSGSGEWGAELVQADGRYEGDFVEYLYQQTVYDQLGLREVPANVTIKGQDGVGTGYWVGESNAIPASAQDFSEVSLTPLKVAAISVISNELIRDSSPAAEMLVRDGLIGAAAQRIDTTFLGAGAAVAGVSPAGILNGVTGKLTGGADADGLRGDVAALYADFITALNARGLEFVMNTSLGKAISLMVNALGQTEFSDMGANGGTLLGDPAHTGDNVAGNDFILLKPSDIWKIGDMGVQVSLSREATIEQDDAPAGESEGPTAATASLVSMFQTESTAFKIVRPMNFQKRRTSAVSFVTDAAYAP